MLNNKDIGQRIRKERERLKLSRQELAELVFLSDYYIGQLERGERQMSLNVLVNLASCLHLSLDYLIFGNKNDLSYIQEDLATYEINSNYYDKELKELFNRCSEPEKELIVKLIKTILPYLQNK